jgi:hypothetical protein
MKRGQHNAPFEQAAQHSAPCTECVPEFLVYPEHEMFASYHNKQILGPRVALCEGLFHVYKAKELGCGNRQATLFGTERDECRPQSMTLVAICGELVGRFTNCKRKHAEEFLVRNVMLKRYIYAHKPKCLVLMMRYHPCHHSGGHAKTAKTDANGNYRYDSRSCAEQILRFNHQVLKPNGVKLQIKISGLYKAFWENAVREDDKTTVQNSLLGLHMLLKDGITISAMQAHDWLLLANLCSDAIEFEHLFVPMRTITDEFIARFLKKQLQLVTET